MKTEKQIQTYILKFLKFIGCYSIKTVVSNRRGIVDIHGCYQGRYFAIEVKAENKDFRDVTKLQRYDLNSVNDAGGFGFFTNSIDHFDILWNFYMDNEFLM